VRVERLILASFGAFAGVEIALPPGMSFFFGQNEEGKSTLIDGLLLGLLGAPAGSERRLRYAPLVGEDYRVTIQLITGGGLAVNFERNLAPGGRDKIAVREGETWMAARKAEVVHKDLDLPAFDLGSALMLICGSEVVLAAKDAEAVSKAVSARATSGEGAVTGQQALKRLDARRVLLENKERRAVNEQLENLRKAQAELGQSQALGETLEKAARRADGEYRAAVDRSCEVLPAIEAFDNCNAAKQAWETAAKRHAEIFAELRAIKEKDEEWARAEQAASPLAPYAAALDGAALSRFHQLGSLVDAYREAAAEKEDKRQGVQTELDLLREKYAFYQRYGFTAERQRDLDRIGGAVSLALRNLADKEGFLGGDKPRLNPVGPIGAAVAGLAGLILGLTGFWPGWILTALSAAGAALIWWRVKNVRSQYGSLLIARDAAVKEVEMVKATLLAASGGRETAVWHEEYAKARELQEQIRAKEAELQVLTGLSNRADQAEEKELAALLATAGCRDEAEYIAKTRLWRELQGKLVEARAGRESLLRNRDRMVLEEQESALARVESAAASVLQEAERLAAGLDPVAIARYREELSGLDPSALEKRAAGAAAAREQHQKTGMKYDPWEVETGLALAEQELARNKSRAGAARLAMEVLEQAITEVQSSLVPRIEARASGLFKALTGGRYEGLEINPGAEMLTVQPRLAGEVLPGRILSGGAADQMYLAVRLALNEALQGPDPLPLILDDPFLTFDRTRLGYALEVLLDLSARQQIVLVTKDEVLRDLAIKAGLAIGSLPGF